MLRDSRKWARVRVMLVSIGVLAALAAVAVSADASSAHKRTAGAAAASATPAAVASPFPNYLKTLAPPSVPKAKKPWNVIFLDASTVLPQQKSIEVGAQDAAKKYGINLKVLDAGGFQNLNTQVSQFQTALGDHPNAIMILPASPVAFNSEINQAMKEGIKVLPLLIPPPKVKFSYALADDLPLDAAKSVDSLAKALHGKGQIMAIIGGAGSSVAEFFTQGMQQELKKYPGIKLVLTKTLQGYVPSDAETAAQDALVAHPQLAGILTNDTILGVGAAKAFKLQHKTVPIAGIGPGDRQTIDALKSGQITVGSGPPFYAVGYDTIEWADYLLAGHTAPTMVKTVAPAVVTKDNINQAIQSGGLWQILAPSAVGCKNNC